MSDTRRDNQDADWWQRAGDRFDQLREDFRQRYDGDEDGLSLAREMELGTSDVEADTDGDGIDDGDEVAAGSDPTVDDAGADPDQDGLTNEEEAEHGTRADRADSDGDGIDDADEVKIGTSPTNADTDGDLLTDGFEVFESETDPVRADSKGDGVDDAFRDGDGDGSPHLREQVRETDPQNPISDPESGKTDGGEPIDRFLSRNAAEGRDTITEADTATAEAAARQTTDPRSTEPVEEEGGFWSTVGDLGSAAYDRAHRWRFDQDGDGLTRLEEKKHGTSDETVDTDGDDIPDLWEIQHPDADPLVKDAHTDPDGDGETLAEEYEKHPDQPRDGIKVDASDSHLPYELVGDGDADYEFVPAGPFGARTGHGVVLDRETGEEVEGSLPPGKVLFQNEKWRFRKNLTEDEADGTRGDDRSRMDTEPPPAGEREPDGWGDGEGEGEAGVGDPTSMRIGIDEPVVEEAEPSVIELLNRGGAGAPGADLGRAAPEPTEEDPSPVGQAVDPDQVAADRFGRDATSIFEGTSAAAATPSGDAVAAVRTSRLDQDGVGAAGRDTTGQGDSGTSPSGDGEEATDSDEASSDEEDSHDDGQENDEGGSTEEDETEDGDETEDETETDVRDSVNQYDPETGETTTYYVDGAGNVYDQNGNPVPPDQVPQWVHDAAASSDGDGGGESGDAASSGGVSTTVDPDGGFGDRTKGEAIEDELGAPTGPPRGPIDPQEAENGVEGRSLRHLITSDDLAQPVPGEATSVGGRGLSSNANASGGRFGTGAIDYGPDHVTHETGPYQDEDVPGAVRTPDDGDGGDDDDHLTEAPRGIALTAEPVNEPEPLQAIATDGREQGLSPQSDDADPAATAPDDGGDDGTWTDPVDEYPAVPEVADDGFEDRSPEPEPEPEPADLGAEPDRFEGVEELL